MMKFLKVTFCFVVLSLIFLSVSGRSNYTLGLIKYLKEQSKLHQVMFIIDDQFLANAESNANAQLIRDVSKNFPSLSMSLHKAQDDLEKYFTLHLQIPRRTTLFAFILNGSEKKYALQLNATLNKVEFLSYHQSYPKCLINFFKTRRAPSYENVLKSLWHKDMLDISILENYVANRSWQTEDVITIHRINLFAKKYTKQKVKPQTKWFPNKLMDLHGHRIRLMSFTFNEKFYESKFIVIRKFKDYIMQSMHCRIEVMVRGNQTISSTHLSKKRVEMVLDTMSLTLINYSVKISKMPILSFITPKAVIANVRSKTRSVEVSQEFIYMIVATTVAIFTIKITALLLQFNRNIWNTFNISQIIMGMSVVNEPGKSAERIVFGVFMLSCMVYSGYMFSVILDINFQEAPKIATLEELANSSLTPMTTHLINMSMLNSPLAHIRKLASKSVQIPVNLRSAYGCLEYLVRNKNVSCIIFDAEDVVKLFNIKYQEFSFHIFQESIDYYPKTWVGRHQSPFIDRFNEIILKAFDHGLLKKLLFNDELRKMENVSSPEIIEKEKLLLVLFYVLAIGYILATVALLVEIFSNFIRSKAKLFLANCLNFF